MHGSCHLTENKTMGGIQFFTDEKGRRVAIQIDDIEDLLVSRSRRNEKRIPLETVKAGLFKSGKLSSE
jgi:hypothetical protein